MAIDAVEIDQLTQWQTENRSIEQAILRFYCAGTGAAGEAVSSCHGGNNRIIANNKINGTTNTDAAASKLSLPKISG